MSPAIGVDSNTRRPIVGIVEASFPTSLIRAPRSLFTGKHLPQSPNLLSVYHGAAPRPPRRVAECSRTQLRTHRGATRSRGWALPNAPRPVCPPWPSSLGSGLRRYTNPVSRPSSFVTGSLALGRASSPVGLDRVTSGGQLRSLYLSPLNIKKPP